MTRQKTPNQLARLITKRTKQAADISEKMSKLLIPDDLEHFRDLEQLKNEILESRDLLHIEYDKISDAIDIDS